MSSMAFPVPEPGVGASELALMDASERKEVVTASGCRIPLVVLAAKSRGKGRRAGDRAPFTILYSHGNAEDLGCCVANMEYMCAVTNCDVVAYDYCGYGIAEGTPSEEGCYEAIDAAFQYVTKDAGVPVEEIILFGRSLGSGPSTDLAARTPGLAGLVILSGLESGIRVVLGKSGGYLFWYLDLFKNYRKIAKVDALVLILHGEEDKVIDVSHGKSLYRRAKRKAEPVWLPDVGHNDVPLEVVFRRLKQFTAEILESTAAR